MTCPGLHCPGCGSCAGGPWRLLITIAAVLAVIVSAAAWLAQRMWVVWSAAGAVAAAGAVLVVLIRVILRRPAMADRQALAMRGRAVAAELSASRPKEISQHVHLHGIDTDSLATLLRQQPEGAVQPPGQVP